MSPSANRTDLQAKMQEYLDNGVQLGILIDRASQQVEYYHPGQSPERFDRPETLSGEDMLPGFVLPMNLIW